MISRIAATAGKLYEGGCHCRAVRFQAIGPLRPIIVCHCRDCLRLAGFSWASTATDQANFTLLTEAEQIDWYASSKIAERGFCRSCRAHLFYRALGSTQISIAAGMLDMHDGLYIAGQIFTDSLPTETLHKLAVPEMIWPIR